MPPQVTPAQRATLAALTLLTAVIALAGDPTRWSRELVGIAEVDHFGTQWFYWFVTEQLSAGASGLGHTDLLFHPWGKDIFLHTGANVLDAVVAAPLLKLLGAVPGYNLFVAAGVAFNALAFHALIREFTEDRVARVGGVLLLTLSPYPLYELVEGRPTQGIIGLLPLFFLQMWRSGVRPGWRAPALAGVLLALAAFQYWFYGLFAGAVCLVHGLIRAITHPRSGALTRHALIAAVALALCLPLGLPLITASASGAAPGLLDTAGWTAQAITPRTVEGHDIALLLWQPLPGLSGFLVADGDAQVFVGHQRLRSWPLLVLLPLYLRWPGSLERRVLLPMLAAAGVLALGPMLIVGETWVPNPLYAALAEALPFLRRLWWPGRAVVVVTVLGGVAGAVGLASLRRLGAWRQIGAVGILVVWSLADLRGSGLLPLPSWDPQVPAGYRCLATGPEGALIEIPYGSTQVHLVYQTVHGRPILGGMLENNPVFSPPQAVALREENTFVATLLATTSARSGPAEWTEADRQAAADLGYRYIILQKDALHHGDDGSDLARRVRRTRLRRVRWALQALVGAPIYEDARTALFSPWGAPPPCDLDALVPDEDPVPVTRGISTSSVQALESRTLRPLLEGEAVSATRTPL